METPETVHVVIAGGGFGGLETALYLRQRLGDGAAITLVSDRDHFLFKPYLTYVPFGLEPNAVQIDLAQMARTHGLTFHPGRIHDLDPAAKTVTVNAQPLTYDYLVVATGATAGPEAIPGLDVQAYTIWKPDDMARLRAAFQHLVDDAESGQQRRVAFLVPPGCRWAGPLYEVAFMLATWLQAHEVREAVDLTFATWAPSHLHALGDAMHETVTQEFDERDIAVHMPWTARRVEDGAVLGNGGALLPFNLLIIAPTYAAAADWAPLPTDDHGFLKTVAATRQVQEHPDVYAVGDASDYPVKQAFLALLQADAAAEHLAARVLDDKPAFAFDPHSIWVMDQLDQAVFARVPLDGSDETTEVDRVPSGEIQRMLLGARLPQPFGESPLYAGLVWKGTTVGLRILSRLIDA